MRKFQGFFFHEEFRSDIAEKMCNGQSSLHRVSATLVKATGNCNVPHDRVGTGTPVSDVCQRLFGLI